MSGVSRVRKFIGLLALVSLIGCTASPTRSPREYLDEQTAATITAVAEPWILVREGSSGSERDFLNLYAIDVNRMGHHRQYIAALQWFPSSSALPVLELHGGGEPISLRAIDEDARSLGIGAPLAPPPVMGSKWWYFPVDKRVLASLAQVRSLRAKLVANDARTTYTAWRDGSAELGELTAVLP